MMGDAAATSLARDEAVRGLDCIANVHLTDLKDLRDPSDHVKAVVEMVLLLMGFKEKEAREWKTARTLVGSTSFIHQILVLGECIIRF